MTVFHCYAGALLIRLERRLATAKTASLENLALATITTCLMAWFSSNVDDNHNNGTSAGLNDNPDIPEFADADFALGDGGRIS
mmetsp:Transcript_27279/g.49221  ORF Transcript_27279/g.49221 Transcript_27279/m.49221 type:complete len:83 (+) Transcript_27279:499-747(+)|eukprot:CAMPEP_0201928298 /NCGR_PEP_ID=MMETSP0903-20130614/20597_1 /ASSEMBLY_ACC=CAM_ASM_000552 /TAXON_ID=420261 /ORGANISM="Thalassiosira antarctica, Strain CCMP982" /LENGTH=82 /DNA_ID=CAMNT_0048466733 /DNA_START=483 /DNA_END=731 /DNA_ORIENTATION=+